MAEMAKLFPNRPTLFCLRVARIFQLRSMLINLKKEGEVSMSRITSLMAWLDSLNGVISNPEFIIDESGFTVMSVRAFTFVRG